MDNALDRLKATMSTPTNEMSLEEQLNAVDVDDATTDDFVMDMSDDARSEFGNMFPSQFEELGEEVDEMPNEVVENSQEQPFEPVFEDISQKIDEKVPKSANFDTFNNNEKKEDNLPKKKVGRKKKEIPNQSESPSVPTDVIFTQKQMLPIFNHMAKEIIEDLKRKKYKLSRMDDETMEVLFTYMLNKF